MPIFHIETTLNNDMSPARSSFLGKPEGRWSAREQATFAATKRTLDRTPLKGTPHCSFQRRSPPYALTGVNAGAVDDVTRSRSSAAPTSRLVMVGGAGRCGHRRAALHLPLTTSTRS